ncbi:MAG: bifunctional pyr operon transcriptional regulator/uracil phosphoribosyltransferase PyrR [Proteobacteria bacterium]|nr:bifunctional pyr operon transcriptional regulator/uracil phosphoribosyltransferase PyrR [Pseudomonadota bacterium]
MSKARKEVLIFDENSFKRVISRIASEIIEKNPDLDKLVLIGIKKGGTYLKERIKKEIEEREKVSLYSGDIDITLYRDDIRRIGYNPKIDTTEIPLNLTDKYVVLIDDVLFTGRTVRAAMDALFDFGRPKRIQLAVMVDRGHRELPIQADFVGKTVPTSRKEIVEVNFKEVQGKDCVILRDNNAKR